MLFFAAFLHPSRACRSSSYRCSMTEAVSDPVSHSHVLQEISLSFTLHSAVDTDDMQILRFVCLDAPLGFWAEPTNLSGGSTR